MGEPPSRRAQRRKQEEAKLVVYGAKKDDKTMATTAKHTTALAPVVSELAALEKEIQDLFAQAMWGSFNMGGGNDGFQMPPKPAARRSAPSRGAPAPQAAAP